MRIAYLTQSYPPMVSGVAVVVQRLAECMTARGHTVLVIAASDRGDSYLTFKNNFLLLRLRSAVNNFRAQQRFLVYPRNSLLKALQDFEPDIIHTHDVFQIGRLGAEFAQSMSIPIVGTLHGLPSFILSYLPNIPGLRSGAEAALWEYGRWSVRRYAAITTPTETISNLVRVMTKVLPHTISNGVDLDAFKPRPFSRDEELRLRERVGIPPDVPIILHVGRLDVDKRVEHVVIAVARAMLSNQAHLLIVGDGNEKPTLIKLSESLGIRERCHFPGFISVDDGLPDIYRIASLLVTASEIETQGLVLLEAAAIGLPIVAVRATCIPEIVDDGINGYLNEPGDITAMAASITTLLKHPMRAKRMGRAGRELAQEHDIRFTLDKHEHLYRQLIEQRQAQVESEGINILENISAR